MKQWVSALVVVFATSGALYAQKRAFSIEDLYRIKSISDVRVSPDGKTVAYFETESDLPRARRVGHFLVMDIYGRNPHQVTFCAKVAVSPRFSPDVKSLLMINSHDLAPSRY